MTAPDHDAARWGATPPGYEATNRTSAAPDHEPICGPSCTPDCGMGHCYLENGPYPEHAHKLNNQANEHAANELLTTPKLAADDLRQQLADVLRRRLGSQLDLFPHAPEFLADGVMAEVQPVLDAKDAEIARLRTERRDWQMAAQTAENELAQLRHQQIGDL